MLKVIILMAAIFATVVLVEGDFRGQLPKENDICKKHRPNNSFDEVKLLRDYIECLKLTSTRYGKRASTYPLHYLMPPFPASYADKSQDLDDYDGNNYN